MSSLEEQVRGLQLQVEPFIVLGTRINNGGIDASGINEATAAEFLKVRDELKSLNLQLTSSIASLESRLSIQEQSSVPKDIAGLTSRVTQLKADNASMKASISALEATVKSLKEEAARSSSFDVKNPRVASSLLKFIVSSMRLKVIQDAIHIAFCRTIGSRTMFGYASWASLLDSKRHPYYGGGYEITDDGFSHSAKHGVKTTIPSFDEIEDSSLLAIRNNPKDNNVDAVGGISHVL